MMKKILLGTTAIVGVSASSLGSGHMPPKRLSCSVSGYLEV